MQRRAGYRTCSYEDVLDTGSVSDLDKRMPQERGRTAFESIKLSWCTDRALLKRSALVLFIRVLRELLCCINIANASVRVLVSTGEENEAKLGNMLLD